MVAVLDNYLQLIQPKRVFSHAAVLRVIGFTNHFISIPSSEQINGIIATLLLLFVVRVNMSHEWYEYFACSTIILF